MKLKVLVDNNTYIDKYYYGEPALSFYIEESNKNILFDTGYSDVIINNASKMNIDLNNLDYIVLSHGHNDHTGGLKFLNNKFINNTILVSHKDAFIKRFDNCLEVGSPIRLDQLNIKQHVDGTKGYKITDNLIFLGEIERKFNYESYPVGTLSNGNPDHVLDDSALVYITKKGLFIITGCSHSGICNIVEKAKNICRNNNIIGIIGGFHLFENDERLCETINYFKENNINNLYPCHCVSLSVKSELKKYFNVEEVAVGFEIII